MGRLNRPALMVYGGTIRAGASAKGEKLDIVSAFSATARYLAGMTDEERRDVVRQACPGAGACGGMYTANTMASAIEAMGMSLPYSSSIPAIDPAKLDECRRAGAAIRLLPGERHQAPRHHDPRGLRKCDGRGDGLGGSTNAVLHLIAMARAVDVPLTIDDFQKVSDRVPFLADLQAERQVRAGRSAQRRRHAGGDEVSARKGLLDGDCLTVTGKTVAENLAKLPGLRAGQDVVHPLETRSSRPGTFRSCAATLPRRGRGQDHGQGRAAILRAGQGASTREEDMLHALEQKEIVKGDVVIIRYEGPKGGPGMPEMLTPTRPSWAPAWARTWR